MNEPSDRARDLILRYRGAIGPSSAQRDALVRGVMTRIDAPAPGGGAAPSSGAPWLVIVGVAVLVGGGLWMGSRDSQTRDPIEPRLVAPSAVIEPVADRRAAASASSVVAPEIVAMQPVDTIEAPVVEPPSERPKAGRRARLPDKKAPLEAAAPIVAPTLVDEEVRLLRAANLALRRGDEQEARARFDEHARRFPDGALVELREVGRALLVCRDDASAIADFARRFPGSPHIARLTNECPR